MRWFFFFLFICMLSACKSSGKKDPNQAMDDTARMRNPPVTTGEFAAMRVPNTEIPASIVIKGVVQEVWKWKDQLGENILIATSIAPYADKDRRYDEEGQTAVLHAFHFAGEGGNLKQLWTSTDSVKACPFDITSEYVRNAISITDIDKDGLAETTLIYRLACRSDVSPSTMKLIMHEGEAGYALQGLTWYGMGDAKFEVTAGNANLEKLPGYKGSDEEFVKTFGRYETERGFANAPPAFLAFARGQWIKFVQESLE